VHHCFVRELPSGIVTLLFTDIEGSTRLLRELGSGYADALAEHRRFLREAFRRHGGVEVDTQGDAFFVAFANAPDALAGAVEAQSVLATGPIRVRMGLHTGAPAVTDEGYVGEDVHLGARIAASAHGGQVVLSKAAADHVDRPLIDLGEHRVKDFEEPVWIYQFGEERFPPLKTISNTNLPRPASSFVGRAREVDEVVSLLSDGARLLTLTGPGGSGKTRLAIEAAAELLGGFRYGVFWVPLATVREQELVASSIAQTVGAHENLAAHFGDKDTLLLLDNLEQVIGAAPDLARLAEACPNLRMIVTSRELLRVRGEVEYEVLPLAECEAVALFCERAQAPASAAVEELCRRLDDMPLALELAAARAKALTPEQIVKRLSDRLDLFKGRRDAEPRQATLRATIEWSYELLSPDERALLQRLAVFAGGCSLEAAEAICEADLDTMQSLVEKSLVRRTGDRFWMLETIREYAVEQLEASGEADALRRRHAEYFLALGGTANLSAESEGPERPDVVRPEQDNFRAAIDWALDHDIELAFRLVIALEQFWVMNDAFEGVRRLGAVLEHGSRVSQVLRARALRTHGESAWITGDFEGGTRLMEEALTEFQRLGDERGVAVVLHRVAVGAILEKDLARARQLLDECLAICERCPSPKLIADAIGKLGWVERSDGNRERALELFEESAARCEEVGFRWMQANAVMDVADLADELGHTDIAWERAREAVRLCREVRDRQFTVYALALLARFAGAAGQAERAGRLWGAIEAEEARGPVGHWEREREQIASTVAIPSPEFESGRSTGRSLSLDEAVEYALGED
jgi:predicted ATPase